MNLKDLILPLAQKDQNLYLALTGLIEEKDILTKKFNDLTEALTLPDMLYGHSHMPKLVRLHRGADQAIPAGPAGAAISWSSPAMFDNDIMYDSAFATRITFKTPGKYIIGAAGRFELPGGFAAILQQIQIKINGTATILDTDIFSGTVDNFLRCVTLCDFAKNDYIELFAIHGAAGPMNFIHLEDYSPTFWAVMQERARNQGPLTENVPSGDFTR